MTRELELHGTKPSITALYELGIGLIIGGCADDLICALESILATTPSNGNMLENFDDSKIGEYMNLGAFQCERYDKTKKLLQKSFPEHDINIIIDLLAATSRNSNIQSNLSLFVDALIEYELRIQNINHKTKKSITKHFGDQIDRIIAGEQISGQKVSQYAEALKGDEMAVTVDTWIVRAFGIERSYIDSKTGELKPGSPTRLDYLRIKYYILKNSKLLGLTPREMTVMIWHGIRIANNSYDDYEQYLAEYVKEYHARKKRYKKRAK